MNSMKRTITPSLRENSAKLLDLVIVESAQQNAVDLDRSEADCLRLADARQNPVEAARNAGDRGEGLRVDGVHADGDAVQSGIFERLRQAFEQVAVGGEGDIEGDPAGAWGSIGEIGRAHLCQLTDHLDEAVAKQRLAAGQPDLFDAQRDEDADHAQVVCDGELGVLRALVAGAAVDALVVAAVGDGDAKIGDGAAVAVAQACLRTAEIRCRDRTLSPIGTSEVEDSCHSFSYRNRCIALRQNMVQDTAIRV